MKVMYILSLGHSGSTILELTLSRFADTVGVGELKKILNRPAKLRREGNRGRTAVCACGKEVADCSFWSTRPQPADHLTLDEKYQRFFQSLSREGTFEMAVDSSKNLKTFGCLAELHRQGAIDLCPVFLVRDVRGWMCSGRNRDQRHHGRVRPYLYYLLQWYRHNVRIKNALDESGIEYFQLGYEQFCFKPVGTTTHIREWAGLRSGQELDWPSTNAHNLNGNRIRREPRQAIIYDSQWFSEAAPSIYPFLLPMIFLWNRRNVYSEMKQR